MITKKVGFGLLLVGFLLIIMVVFDFITATQLHSVPATPGTNSLTNTFSTLHKDAIPIIAGVGLMAIGMALVKIGSRL